MRKVTCGIAAAILCAAAACAGVCESEALNNKPRLVLVSREQPATWAHVCIVYDAETKVMYMIARNGSVTPMIDAKGMPLIYAEDGGCE